MPPLTAKETSENSPPAGGSVAAMVAMRSSMNRLQTGGARTPELLNAGPGRAARARSRRRPPDTACRSARRISRVVFCGRRSHRTRFLRPIPASRHAGDRRPVGGRGWDELYAWYFAGRQFPRGVARDRHWGFQLRKRGTRREGPHQVLRKLLDEHSTHQKLCDFARNVGRRTRAHGLVPIENANFFRHGG
jgi:hypothetical protein